MVTSEKNWTAVLIKIIVFNAHQVEWGLCWRTWPFLPIFDNRRNKLLVSNCKFRYIRWTLIAHLCCFISTERKTARTRGQVERSFSSLPGLHGRSSPQRWPGHVQLAVTKVSDFKTLPSSFRETAWRDYYYTVCVYMWMTVPEETRVLWGIRHGCWEPNSARALCALSCRATSPSLGRLSF